MKIDICLYEQKKSDDKKMLKGEHFNKKHENRAIKCIRVRDENKHYHTTRDHSNYEKNDSHDKIMRYS
jgi:hypothetical protein